MVPSADAVARRAFVLGLDGAPCSLLRRFMAEGLMPRLARLAGDDGLVPMDSCTPTVSNVAWSCFQTGRNPGAFGIYGFAELTERRDLRIPTAADLRAPTLWRTLTRAGRRVVALGVPQTFPPPAVNGLLVSGFLAPRLEGAVHPPHWVERLREWGYRLDVDPLKARESLDHLRGDLLDGLAGRERAFEGLCDAEPWDLFVLHVMETDRINHFMWRFLETPQEPHGAFFRDFYRRLDAFIGRIADRLDDDTAFILLSDHGFCATVKEVQVNRWLARRGYLRADGDPAQGFAGVRGEAVALVPGRIYLLDGGAGEVRERLIADLRAWRDPETGRPICAEVQPREALFSGPCLEAAPHIVCHPTDGYDLKAALGPGEVFTSSPICGMHTRHDAALLIRLGGASRQAPPAAGRKPHLCDLMPTLLDLLGVEPPPDLEGRSLL